MRNAVAAASAAYTPSGPGSSSIAITAAAIGVFGAAASIATSPTAARNVVGAPKNGANAAPLVAPMKKIGVTMPPLPPVSSVIDVAGILRRNPQARTGVVPASTPLIVSVPRPAYVSPAAKYRSTNSTPPDAASRDGRRSNG